MSPTRVAQCPICLLAAPFDCELVNTLSGLMMIGQQQAAPSQFANVCVLYTLSFFQSLPVRILVTFILVGDRTESAK